MDKQGQRQHAKRHVNPKLQRSLRLFLVISLILLAVVIYDTVRYRATVWEVIIGLLAGIIAGMIFTRMYKLSWDDRAQHITNNIDKFGMAILILYVVFDLSRGHLVHVFTYSKSVPAISLALLAGAMYGRVLGSIHVIVRLLREQEIFSANHKH